MDRQEQPHKADGVQRCPTQVMSQSTGQREEPAVMGKTVSAQQIGTIVNPVHSLCGRKTVATLAR